MVEKMCKYAWLVYHKEYDMFLERLRALGVVHVNHSKMTANHPILQKLKTEEKRVSGVINYLNQLLKENDEKIPGDHIATPDNTLSHSGSEQLLERIEHLQDKLSKLQVSISIKEKEKSAISVWGDFCYTNISRFHKAGYHVRFFTCSESHYKKEWEDEFDAIVINKLQTHVYFITITHAGMKVSIDAEHAKLPPHDYRYLCHAIEQDVNQKKAIETELLEIARHNSQSLKQLKVEIENKTAWNQVKIETKQHVDNKVMLLEGWTPAANAAEMERSLNNESCYYQQLETTDADTIPIKLKNNRFSKLFEPIGELYTLPQYGELDLTPFFAPFYMLFFGLCLGDAGYGLLIVLGALFARSKVKPSFKPLLSLAVALGASTFICGAIGGTLFGIPLPDMEWAWLSSYKKYMLNADKLFNLAVILGGIQILYAWFVKFFNAMHRYGWKYSLEPLGWIILAVGGGSLYVASDKLSPVMTTYFIYAIAITAGTLIFLFNDPKRNPLINVGAGLWNAFNMITGFIGDLLSYMRLFAVGLSSGILGFVFNQLATQLKPDIPVVGHIIMIIILLMGHSINLFIACLGAFVHPVRLTFVEFYKNAGFEGGGKPYKPFKRIMN